jgi:hypothetical protein
MRDLESIIQSIAYGVDGSPCEYCKFKDLDNYYCENCDDSLKRKHSNFVLSEKMISYYKEIIQEQKRRKHDLE